MTKTMKPVDAVVIGLGWTGGIAAIELVNAGLSVVALERGEGYTNAGDFETNRMFDHLRYSIRNQLALQPDRSTLTFRNSVKDAALPMRRIGSFNPGSGYGGSGNTWSGHTFRALPSDLTLRSHYTKRYGADFLPDGMTVQDWGVTYAELEPHYDMFERVAAVSGTAGNIGGRKRSGGNPFEGPRSREYPLQAFERTASGLKFIEGAKSLGYHPFAVPVANSSAEYTNPYGVKFGSCRVCGHCPGFACTYRAKGSSVNAILPALANKSSFEARPNSTVVRIEKRDGRATGVTYIDAAGFEVFQPASMVILAAYTFDNSRILLLSGIGKPYDPASGEGVVGRNYSYQVLGHVEGFFEKEEFNPFVAGGSAGTVIDDFNGDNFDHGPLGFVGGGFIGPFNLDAFPVTYQPLPDGAPRWGAGWKEAVKKWYPRQIGLNLHAAVQSYRGNYLSLDPTFKDDHGRPMLRLTFDHTENERKMLRFLTERGEAVMKAMGPTSMRSSPVPTRYDIAQYQTTHNVGGTVMGIDPRTSVVNRYLQNWELHNLFVLGGSVFPQNTGYNPTGTIGALAYWSLHHIKSNYLKQPGPLA